MAGVAPGTDLSGRLGDAAGSGAKATGFLGGMDPLTIGLGVANIGTKLYGAIRGQNIASQIGRAKMDAARDSLARNIQLQRDASKFSEGSKIGSRVADFGYGADLDLARQKGYDRFSRTELADLDFANALRGRQADRAFELSGDTQEVYDKQLQRKMKEAVGQRLAQGRGMFGAIAPVNVDSMVI